MDVRWRMDGVGGCDFDGGGVGSCSVFVRFGGGWGGLAGGGLGEMDYGWVRLSLHPLMEG